MLSFEPFRIWATIHQKTRKQVAMDCEVSLPTIYRVWKDEPVSSELIHKLCSVYDLPIQEVMQYKKDPSA